MKTRIRLAALAALFCGLGSVSKADFDIQIDSWGIMFNSGWQLVNFTVTVNDPDNDLQGVSFYSTDFLGSEHGFGTTGDTSSRTGSGSDSTYDGEVPGRVLVTNSVDTYEYDVTYYL
jgi:hypothetical protein